MITHPAKPAGKPIDIEALHADIQRRFPKTMEALRQSELADFDLEGLRVTEEICADRIARRKAEQALATFFARPEYAEIRPLLEQIAPSSTAPIDALVLKIRREVWKDLSTPD